MSDTKPVFYMERTRLYYEAQGFDKAYQYASHDSAPFAPMQKPLADSKVAIVMTASTYHREDLEPRKVDVGSTLSAPTKLYTDDLSWDKNATHTEDVNSFCPIGPLRELEKQGGIGELNSRFFCVPTEYSQSATVEQDAPRILKSLQEDEVDVALLVPL
jgi:D-proline reductase (dithiol) PrdB